MDIKANTTIYTVLRHASRSGLTKYVSFFVVRDGEIVPVDAYISSVLGEMFSLTRKGLRVRGAGMDPAYHVVYELSRKLFGDGYKLRHRWL